MKFTVWKSLQLYEKRGVTEESLRDKVRNRWCRKLEKIDWIRYHYKV
jgi:hypothetical protein